MRNFSLCDYRGWNEFVSYISGGLLFGKEVVRPGWLRYERKQVRVRVRGGKGGESAKRVKIAKPRAALGAGAVGEMGG